MIIGKQILRGASRRHDPPRTTRNGNPTITENLKAFGRLTSRAQIFEELIDVTPAEL